jgi:hypothetical protein
MFSRILLKLVDQAILPAVLLLATRIVSVLLISQKLEMFFDINHTGIVFGKLADYLVVNSYSMLFMTGALVLGLTYIILKSYLFHDSHISPSLSAKVFSLNIPSFIQTSFDLYSQGTIWISYLFLMLIITGIMSLFGMVYPWVFHLSFVFTVVITVLLVLDVEHELRISKEKGPGLDKDVFYVGDEQE